MTKPHFVKLTIFILGVIGILLITLFIKGESSLALPSSENDIKNAYNEDFANKLESTNFTSDVLQAIREKGYDPEGGIGFVIDSPNKQIIAIYLNNIDKVDEKVIKDIQDIVDITSKNNDFNPFVVEVQIMGVN